MSEFYGRATMPNRSATIHRALELGITMLDTADMYGTGDNEVLVGKAIAEHRDRAFSRPSSASFAIRQSDAAQHQRRARSTSSPRATRRSSASNIDHIDLYYQHRVDLDVPIEETVGAMSDLIRAGKVRLSGALRSQRRDRAPRAGGPSDRRAAKRMVALVARSGIQRPARDGARTRHRLSSPTARSAAAFLPARLKTRDDFAEDDFRRIRRASPRENFGKNLELVAMVEALAGAQGLHRRTSRARVAARARRRRRSDSRDEAREVRRGERRRAQSRTLGRRARANSIRSFHPAPPAASAIPT